MSDFNGRNDWRAPSHDHVIPRSRGGRNTIANIMICCRRCNQEKGSLTREEFLSRGHAR
jgi:5-methylcytosine-specific restriction endonuclease McrA